LLMLSLDTATLVSTVALATEDKVIAEFTLQTTKTHSEKLMPTIDMLCQFAGVQASDIEAIAVSTGPGSFTGLRIGLATAKALSYANSLPLIGVPTLMGLAYNFSSSSCLIVPVLDAQKGNVYHASYRFEQGKLNEIQAVNVMAAADLCHELEELGQSVILVGEATSIVMESAKETTLLQVAEPHLLMPRAASIAQAAFKTFEAGQVADAMTLTPVYVRRSEAEVLWEKRQSCSHE
jgi:tRNA threonylcarbamoyladenosine biosynthesis protein TsaB